jgi:hypothetical protein
MAFDIGNSAPSSIYPRHGWAENSDGIRLLWLPIMRLFRNVADVRKAKGLPGVLTGGDVHAVAAFYPCLCNLAVGLREIAQLTREDDAIILDSDAKLVKRYRTDELVKLHLDGVFVQLRRLADRFASASRVLLFSKHRSASTQFKKLRNAALDANEMAKLGPVVDVSVLAKAFRDHTQWFDELRNEGATEGIRDQMEHRSVEVLVSGQRINEGPVVRTAYLTRPTGGIDADRELFKLLREILADLCEFLTGVHAAVGFGETYGRDDNFLVFGADADIVEWWPMLWVPTTSHEMADVRTGGTIPSPAQAG